MDPNFIQDNLPLFIGGFVVICVVFVGLQIIAGKKQKSKKESMLSSDNNLVEVIFDYPAMKKPFGNPGQSAYIIHSVNNQLFKIIKGTIVVPAGTLEIDIEFYQKIVGLNLAKSLLREKYTFDLRKGKKYLIKYKYMENIFECKEIE